MKHNLIIRILALVVCITGVLISDTFAQATGKITGKLNDKKTGETLIGVSVKISGTTKGASSDVEGRYTLGGLAAGNYTLEFSYVGYPTKKISDIVVSAGKVTNLDVIMEESGQELQQVVITATAKQESISGLYVQQKNAISISSGITADLIRRSPDKNTSEVLKRVSGASIQDNKFVVVRGLSDRYNSAQINGAILPSSEPDKKAFSFDIFPSNLVDRIVVNKTASADLPGDFAGGVIQIFTKDVPDQSFVEFSIGNGFNSQSTGKEFVSNGRGRTDWLGFFASSRKLPSAFPASFQQYQGLTNEQKASASRLLPNSYVESKATALPIQNSQFTWGGRKDLKNDGVLGGILSLTYRNAQNLYDYKRNDWDNPGSRTIFAKEFDDKQNKLNVTWGALGNFSYKKGNNKFSWKNSYSRILDELYYTRNGINNNNLVDINFKSNDPVQRSLYNTQIEGDHLLNSKQYKLTWNANYASIKREQTDLRTLEYAKPQTGNYSFDMVDRNSRRFFSNLNEKNFGGSGNLSIPIDGSKVKNTLKGGLLGLYKKRDFSARVFNYQTLASGAEEQELRSLPFDQIFAPENIQANKFVLNDFTNKTDKYNAQSLLGAGYLMLDSKLNDLLRLVIGTRLEYYYQNLDAVGVDLKKVDAEQEYLDLLPSLNLSYSLADNSSIRLSGSRTVSRPEFRELAPFSFYDYQLGALVSGNPELLRSSNWNADIRYEIYPSGGEAITVSGFYKYFQNPIEFFANSQSNSDLRAFSYNNSTSASIFGAEIDLRKKLGFIADKAWLNNLTAFANASLISSNVVVPKSLGISDRPLQGQSPYLLNGGLQYLAQKSGLMFTALYNRVGQRLNVVGYDGYPDWYENARDVIDLQISDRILKGKGELKLNVSDILNQQSIVYQNLDGKNSYNRSSDRNIYNYKPGSVISFTFGYRL